MRHTLRCAPTLLLTKQIDDKEYILLQRRKSLYDGLWGASSCGHLEKGETLKEGIIRETKEEIGIEIKKEDLKFVNIVNAKFEGIEYIMPVFQTNKYQGKEQVKEPDKCYEIKWFDIHNLPENMITNRKQMITDYLNNNYYTEEGF